MAIPPHTILKALRSQYAHLHAPVVAAEAALAQAERTLNAAQRASVDATKILVKIDKTSSAIIDPLRAQAQAGYDDARAAQHIAQAAVVSARQQLIDAYAQCARDAQTAYDAALRAVDPDRLTPDLAADAAPAGKVMQPPLFVHKPDIKGKKR
ncbi:MAG: hypothetical protein DWI54_00875 [Chloroflexi bacterium]|nr:MAG: hypothetical protein DWI54_00875 [Chloroflexota bacterium]